MIPIFKLIETNVMALIVYHYIMTLLNHIWTNFTMWLKKWLQVQHFRHRKQAVLWLQHVLFYTEWIHKNQLISTFQKSSIWLMRQSVLKKNKVFLYQRLRIFLRNKFIFIKRVKELFSSELFKKYLFNFKKRL